MQVQVQPRFLWADASDAPIGPTGMVAPGETLNLRLAIQVPDQVEPRGPYYLWQPRDGDLYHWSGPFRGVPFEPPLIVAHFTLRDGSADPIEVDREVAYRYNDQARGEVREPVTIVPRLDVKLEPAMAVWRAGAATPRQFTVTVTHNTASPSTGTVGLELPAGWRQTPAQRFRLVRDGERQVFHFTVHPPALTSGSFQVRAVANDGTRQVLGVTPVSYSHIRPRNLVRPATATVHVAPLALPALTRIAYVRGAADRVPEALQQVGLPITLITGADIETTDLSRYQAIVIGPRAFEVDPDLPAANDQLLRYAERGGLVITQYQQYAYFLGNMAPFALTVGGRTPGTAQTSAVALSTDSTRGARPNTAATGGTALLGGHDRVTDENAAVTVVNRSSPVLRVPNRIDPRDWEGWVQERGLYFARTWAAPFQSVLAMHDPGESPLEGGLLIAPVGKGTYVYTGIELLPAVAGRGAGGVPVVRESAGARVGEVTLPHGSREATKESEGAKQSVMPSLRFASSRECWWFLLLLALGCNDGRIPLTIYSPHGRDHLTLLEKDFERLHPEIDVRWLDLGSQEILDRLRLERVNPQADLWFGGPTTLFQRGVAESLLVAYRPSWAGQVDSGGIGPQDLYYPAYRTPAIIAYNSDAVPDSLAPQDWDDMLLPQWKDKVLIRDPVASGTMRAIWGLLLQRSLQQTGDTAAGMAWLRRLDGQTRSYAISPALLDAKLARREGLVTLWDLPDILIARSKGMPFGYTFPSSGTVVIDDAIALVRHARHPDAARLFYEYVGSVDGQILAAEKVFRLPARHDLPLGRVPAWVAEVENKMRVAPMDWALLTKQGAAWMGYWDQHVRNTGKPQ